MSEKLDYSQFWRGRAVRAPELEEYFNPGHVHSFVDVGRGEIYIRVEFANGDRYNVDPEELEVL